MKSSYFTIALIAILLSCSDHHDNESPLIINSLTLTEHEQDSILQNHVSLSDISYTLDISLKDAELLGITKSVYENTLIKINNINTHTSQRRDSGDIIICTPPRKDAIKTKVLHPKDPDMDKLVYFTNSYLNDFGKPYYHFFKGPEYLFGLISGSNTCYYSVTISFTGTYLGPSYTITSANNTENTGILIKNPAPPSKQLPEGALCPDLYDTHYWEIETSYYNGGWWMQPPILFLIRRGYGDV